MDLEAGDAIADLEPRPGFLQQVAAARCDDAAVAADRDVGAVADRFVEPDDQVAWVVVGRLDRIDLDPVARSARRPATVPRIAAHCRETMRSGMLKRSASATTSARSGTVRKQRPGAPSAARGRRRVGVARRTRQAHPHLTVEQTVAVPAVVRAPATPNDGLAQVDEPVGAHLELGGVPRRRRVGRPSDVTELDVAGRGVGVHVEREHHRQQVLVVLPVEVDVDVEARAPGAEHL